MDWQFLNFTCAESYYYIYHQAMSTAFKQRDEMTLGMTQAAFANQAFSLEAYLKCVLSIEENEKRGHEFLDLFQSLAVESKKRITELYNQISDNDPSRLAKRRELGDMSDYSITGILSEAKYAYQNFRYVFQKETAPAQGTSRSYRVEPVIKAIRMYLKEIRPDWKQIENKLEY
jgi:hypothetical protein